MDKGILFSYFGGSSSVVWAWSGLCFFRKVKECWAETLAVPISASESWTKIVLIFMFSIWFAVQKYMDIIHNLLFYARCFKGFLCL